MSGLGAGYTDFANLPDPKSYKASLASPDNALWAAARQTEIASLESNNTWVVVPVEPGMHLLRSQWVNKKKRDGDGNVSQYKARLVAGGDGQIFGTEYTLTFAAVMDMTSMKVILVLALHYKVPARHFDVPSAYVKADKNDGSTIHLRIPDGMSFTAEELQAMGVTSSAQLCLRLEKSLYGLKQAGRLWGKLLHDTLIRIGFEQCVTDACLYRKIDKDGITVVCAYVDDLLATGSSTERVDDFYNAMASLDLKDLGPAKHFLGMRLGYDQTSGYKIDQESTIVELLARNKMDKANAVRVPVCEESAIEASVEENALLPSKGPGTQEAPTVRSFQSLVGSLLWIARCTRPDIAFAVHRATRKTHAPTYQDFKMAKRILRYLAGTAQLKLTMKADQDAATAMRVSAYTDADYAADKATRKSINGATVHLNGAIVGWHCKQQKSVALSTTEAEFVSAATGVKEMLGLKELMGELGIPVEMPMVVKVDNQAAIKQIENEASSATAKHVDTKLKFIKDESRRGVIKAEFVGTKENVADLLTKAMAAPKLAELRGMVGL